MIVYTHGGGYGNVDTKKLRQLRDKLGGDNYADLAELIYDYECLRRVIEGDGAIFRHDDGSETRRIRLYG